MRYKATLGTNAIIVTMGISLLFCSLAGYFVYRAFVSTEVIEVIAAIAVTLLLGTLYTITYLYGPRSYVIDGDNIVIDRPIKNVSIALRDVKDAYTVRKESMNFPERVGGNAGLFGFYGSFRNHFGLMTWYATRNNNFIMIETFDNDRIVITPDNTDLVKVIRKRIGK